jgi:hypothetical protein
MTVLKSFSCNICFRTCSAEGITLAMEQIPKTPTYRIAQKRAGLHDTHISGTLASHICQDCATIIKTKINYTRAKEDKDNG